MFPITHFIKGIVRNLFNKRVSLLSLVSINNEIDEKSCIYRFCKVKGSKIGAYSYIGNKTVLENAEIGKFCSISDRCRIGMGSHTINLLSTSSIFTEVINGTQYKWVKKNTNAAPNLKTVIGNDVWVGYQSIILGGVNIGDGAVIGAGAVVVKDVPPYAVVGGVPAKVIKYRFPKEIVDKLVDIKWWNFPEEVLKNNLHLFQSEDLKIDELQRLSNVITK